MSSGEIEILRRVITVRVRTIDRFSKSRQFRTIAGAQKFAQRYVGETPELGSFYAVSSDGVARVTSDIPVENLFPKLKAQAVEDARADREHYMEWPRGWDMIEG